MDKIEQLDYLGAKYSELKQKYLHELNDGQSLDMIKDLSFVLDTLWQEIQSLERQVNKEAPLRTKV